MEQKIFEKVIQRGHFVAWEKDNDGVTAIAYMSGNGWFNVAINCCRDGDMGEKDCWGVYNRKWWTDMVWIENEPREARLDEALLYLQEVNILDAEIIEEGKPLPIFVMEDGRLRVKYPDVLPINARPYINEM